MKDKKFYEKLKIWRPTLDPATIYIIYFNSFTYESISKKNKITGNFWTKNGGTRNEDRSRCPEGAHSRELVHIIT